VELRLVSRSNSQASSLDESKYHDVYYLNSTIYGIGSLGHGTWFFKFSLDRRNAFFKVEGVWEYKETLVSEKELKLPLMVRQNPYRLTVSWSAMAPIFPGIIEEQGKLIDFDVGEAIDQRRHVVRPRGQSLFAFPPPHYQQLSTKRRHTISGSTRKRKKKSLTRKPSSEDLLEARTSESLAISASPATPVMPAKPPILQPILGIPRPGIGAAHVVNTRTNRQSEKPTRNEFANDQSKQECLNLPLRARLPMEQVASINAQRSQERLNIPLPTDRLQKQQTRIDVLGGHLGQIGEESLKLALLKDRPRMSPANMDASGVHLSHEGVESPKSPMNRPVQSSTNISTPVNLIAQQSADQSLYQPLEGTSNTDVSVNHAHDGESLGQSTTVHVPADHSKGKSLDLVPSWSVEQSATLNALGSYTREESLDRSLERILGPFIDDNALEGHAEEEGPARSFDRRSGQSTNINVLGDQRTEGNVLDNDPVTIVDPIQPGI